jgi:histone-lysine N-methyltransferase SETMAR
MDWRHSSTPINKIFKQTITTRKITCTVFSDRKRVLLVEFLPQGSTFNAGVYCDTLKKLRRAIQKKRRGVLSRGILMLRNNARPHSAAAAQDFIAAFGWEQFDHAPLSLDLAPSYFYMFLHLKTFLGSRRFHDDNEVKEAVDTWFVSQAASFYDAGYKNWCPATSASTMVGTTATSSLWYVHQMAI